MHWFQPRTSATTYTWPVEIRYESELHSYLGGGSLFDPQHIALAVVMIQLHLFGSAMPSYQPIVFTQEKILAGSKARGSLGTICILARAELDRIGILVG